MKLRMLALMAILAVAFTAAPALAGPPHHPRHTPPRYGWNGPHRMPPPPPVVHRHYRPPVYVGPRVIPGPPAHRYGYWYPGPHYYEPGLRIGVARGGIGLHIEF